MREGNILLICPFFYGYHNEIYKVLKGKYENVYMFSEYPLGTPIKYFSAEKIPGVKKKLWQRYVDKITKLTKHVKFKKILIIRGNLLPEAFIKYLSDIPNCELIQYQWDSIRNNPNGLIIQKYASKSFTFDKSDATDNSGFRYLPLFYISDNHLNHSIEDLDILYVGTWSFERIEAIHSIGEICKKKNLKIYVHIVIHILSFIKRYRIFKKFPLNYFKFSKLSYTKYLRLLEHSKAVFDVPSKTQVGTTMRTIEALSFRKKIITTNSMVKQEKFYRKENFLIWPREEYRIKDFLDIPFNDESLCNINSLQSWLQEIGV